MSDPICEWCNNQIMGYEVYCVVDGEPMHIDCAQDEEDEQMFSRDMGYE